MEQLLGAAAGTVALVTIVEWGRRMMAVRIPEDRRPFQAAMAAALLIGVGAMFAGADGWAHTGARMGVVLGALFLGLNMISAQESKEPAVAVGGSILDFSAPDENGETFELASLRGKPFLLKFFRGHW